MRWLTFKQKRTSLSFAAERGHLDIVTYLVENGADIDKADNQVGGHGGLIINSTLWNVAKLLDPKISISR